MGILDWLVLPRRVPCAVHGRASCQTSSDGPRDNEAADVRDARLGSVTNGGKDAGRGKLTGSAEHFFMPIIDAVPTIVQLSLMS